MMIESKSAITTQAVNSSQGQAGDITIKANRFIELNNGFINTKAVQDDGGVIQITVGGSINLSDDSEITAEARMNGGSITIDANQLIRLMNSEITAQSGNNGEILPSRTMRPYFRMVE